MVFSSLFGGGDRVKAGKKAADAQNKQNQQDWKYGNKVRKDTNKYARKSVKISRENEKTFREYQDSSNLQEYTDTLKIREFEYGQQVRQFNQSEKNYGLQRKFNAIAAGQAQEAEQRRFEEITNGMAFEQQDMLVKMLEQEGMTRASGGSGRSAGKSLGAVLAGYGRNQAIMAESLLSAKRDSQANFRQIDQDRYGADLAAEARRMLMPQRAPDPSKPLPAPVARIQDAFKQRRAPKPIEVKNQVSAPKWYDYADSALSIATMFM